MNVKSKTRIAALTGSLAMAVAAAPVAAQGVDREDLSAHAQIAAYDVDGLSDNGTMLVIGGGYHFSELFSIKADYGVSIQDAETSRTFSDGFGNTADVDIDLELTQIRGYFEGQFPFGESNFGARARAGVANLDGDVSISNQIPDGSPDSATTDADETGLMLGGGFYWQPSREHQISVNFDSPSSDVNTLSAGYDYRF